MMIETKLRELAMQTQDLLLCDGACIRLGCSDQALRHDLLARCLPCSALPPIFAPLTAPVFYSASAGERVTAACDIALQTGITWSIEHLPLDSHQMGSMLACPVMLPAGRLGVLLVFSTRPAAFCSGDFALLEQYRAHLSQQFEDILTRELRHRQDTLLPEGQTFASIMGHELRAPLAAIKGYASLLRSYDSAEAQETRMPIQQRQHYLDAILEQTDHLTALVQDMLDVSRLQRGALRLQFTVVDVGQLCRGIAEQIQARVDQQQPGMYRIHCYVDSGIPALLADSVRIRQILANLLENAVKYSPHGGTIEVRVSARPLSPSGISKEKGEICIMVRDWGIGIPSQQQEAVFQPFVRLEHPLTRHVPGHGLGLSVSRYLAEAMGGSLTFMSDERPGACAVLALPLIIGDASCVTCQVQSGLL